MKKTFHRAMALLLAAALLLTSVAATSVLGSWTKYKTYALNGGATLEHSVFYNSTTKYQQTENVVTAATGSGVQPMVAFGTTLYGRSKLDYVCQYVQSLGKTVVAAINASFFDTSTGIPYGCEITDGVLRSSGDTNSIGFFSDGTAVIGKPGLNISMQSGTYSFSALNYNKALSLTSGLVLFSQDYDYSTKSAVPSYNVVLKPDGAMTPGATVTATVVSAAAYSNDGFTIPDGCLVLSMAAKTGYVGTLNDFLLTLSAGDSLTLNIGLDDGWSGASYVCGGGDLLVSNGKACTSFTLDSAGSRTARTAVGVKADGTLVFYTVDGLQEDYSIGITLTELAARLAELGCVTALNLDGGGSTTIGVTASGYSSVILANSPSDGSERKCANFLFLVADAPDATQASETPSASDSESASPSASASTEPSAVPSASTGSSDLTVWGMEQGQTQAESGVGITASVCTNINYVRYGKRSLQLNYDLSGNKQVACEIDETLASSADTLGFWVYGDGSGNAFSVRLNQGGTVQSTWACTLSFTGWKYVTVSVPSGEKTLSGFAVTAQDGAAVSAGTVYVDQLVASSGAVSDTTPPSISASVSGGVLTAQIADSGSGVSAGNVSVRLDGASLAFAYTGTALTATVPDDGTVHKILITAADACGNLASASVETVGTVSDPFSDTAGHWAETPICWLYGKGILTGSTDASGSLLYRPDDCMTREEFAVALIRWLGIDASQYSSVSLPYADAGQIDSWAGNAMRAAYSLGLITGSSDNGTLNANPLSSVTRQETMAILGRTQEKGYAEADLTGFSDSASVASWASSAIASMVTRGVISGSDGKLDPTGAVTRAQIAKMLYGLS